MKDPIIGLGRLCSFDKNCKEDAPCLRCVEIGRTAKDKAVFAPKEELEIQKWLDENRDLMDDLVKLGD